LVPVSPRSRRLIVTGSLVVLIALVIVGTLLGLGR